MRLSKHKWLMGLAALTAQRSTCLRRQVGCVLINKRGHILATGYNGVAAGLPHCNEQDPNIIETFGPLSEKEIYINACEGALAESGTELDACQAIHAEQNALLQCRDVYDIYAAYVTTSPCITCTKLLLNTSCQQIIFMEQYPHHEAEKLWLSAGREWNQIDYSFSFCYL
jgi:dCMP deaminase